LPHWISRLREKSFWTGKILWRSVRKRSLHSDGIISDLFFRILTY
jgi:L_ocin_972_ABC: putative bacteriocin export ABC transporter, lactococcin 972 group